MIYEDVVAFCARAAGLQPDAKVTLLDCVNILAQHSGFNRAIMAEVMARFMAEYIEYDRPKKVVH